MNVIDKVNFSSFVVPFSVSKVNAVTTIWVDKEYEEELGESAGKKFSDLFSYAIQGNECFEGFQFDNKTQRIYEAECYGGQGVGDNRGGARCGNYDGFQIKGIGQNPLVGEAKEKWHSYGGLQAKDAIYELIYAQVIEKLLPVGVAKVFGVMLTASDGAYGSYHDDTGKFTKVWGALLVREVCLRPGHFIRAPIYKKKKNMAVRIMPDVARVRFINRQFYKSFENTNALIMFLGKFLQNCANQFAFARVARITHTGIGSSNLCFDGRWIDLTNTSFIGGGENVGGTPPFYDEPLAIVDIIKEFVDTISKYNGINLNVVPLINYYHEQLSAYFGFHAAYLFAIDYSHLDESTKNNEYKSLVDQVSFVINSGRMVINQWPEKIKAGDPVVALIKSLFLSLFDHQRANEQLKLLSCINKFQSEKAIENFKKVIKSVYENSKNNGISYKIFLVSIAIAALKRALYSEYFYKIRLDKRIAYILDEDALGMSGQFIEDSISMADWIFHSADDGLIYFYRYNSILLSFNKNTGAYLFSDDSSGVIEQYESAASFASKIACLGGDQLTIQGFSFKEHIVTILDLVKRIEAGCEELK
jgi:hypothetical protein